MKKIIILFCICLITGCSANKENMISTLPTGYSYIFNKKDNQRVFKTIYEYEDGRKIITEFDSIEYEDYDNNTGKNKLEDAIKNNITTIDDLINRIHYIDTFKDGGSKLYSFDEKSNTYLVVCHTLNGNKNIVIGTDSDIIEQCK